MGRDGMQPFIGQTRYLCKGLSKMQGVHPHLAPHTAYLSLGAPLLGHVCLHTNHLLSLEIAEKTIYVKASSLSSGTPRAGNGKLRGGAGGGESRD